MDEFEIIFYDKPNGDEPAKDFICSLDAKMKARRLRMVNLLGEYGNKLIKPYSEHLEDGIFELQAKVGSDISRVLYFFVTGKSEESKCLSL